MRGLVVKKNADLFDVRFGEQVFACSCRGSLKKEGVFVGDKVEFNKNDLVIESVLKRKNLLIRPPMANLDKMFIVIAPKPLPDLYLVDKLILFCFVNGIDPVLCVNKIDSKAELEFYDKINDIYHKIVKVKKLSAKNGEVKEILGEVKGVCAFAGQSAVGKSSLINAIFGEAKEKIGDFAKKVERGKQTTRTVTLYKLKSGFLADTAGFSKLDESLIDLKPNEIAKYYPDFLEYIEKCKFRSCLHQNGKDCEIIKQVNLGNISKERYKSYLKFLEIKKNEKKWELKWKKMFMFLFQQIQ